MARKYEGVNFRDRVKLAIDGLAAERAAAGPAGDGAGAVDAGGKDFGWGEGDEAADSRAEAKTAEAEDDDDIINF
jgi:hypothetical protein